MCCLRFGSEMEILDAFTEGAADAPREWQVCSLQGDFSFLPLRQAPDTWT